MPSNSVYEPGDTKKTKTKIRNTAMKHIQTLLCAAVIGAITFAAGKASAFPLYLKSANGTITVTTNYSVLYSTNQAKFTKKRFSLKQVMFIVTNTVYQNSGVMPPKDAQLAWDPYGSDYPFLTNSAGYYYSLSGIGYAYVEDIATSFKGNNSGGGVEKDQIVFYLDIYGYDPDGNYTEFYQDYGTGTLKMNMNGKTGVAKMTVQSKGGGYGALFNSNDGVSTSRVIFSGTGTPPSGPYSLWWY